VTAHRPQHLLLVLLGVGVSGLLELLVQLSAGLVPQTHQSLSLRLGGRSCTTFLLWSYDDGHRQPADRERVHAEHALPHSPPSRQLCVSSSSALSGQSSSGPQLQPRAQLAEQQQSETAVDAPRARQTVPGCGASLLCTRAALPVASDSYWHSLVPQPHSRHWRDYERGTPAPCRACLSGLLPFSHQLDST